MTEADILHENGAYWVSRERRKGKPDRYKVWRIGVTHSTLTGTFGSGADYLAKAIAFADKRAAESV